MHRLKARLYVLKTLKSDVKAGSTDYMVECSFIKSGESIKLFRWSNLLVMFVEYTDGLIVPSLDIREVF